MGKELNTPALERLVGHALQDLAAGALDPDGQRYAAEILGEYIRRFDNTKRALAQSAEILHRY